MNELIYQPLFDEQQKAYGYIIRLDMFGLGGLIFCFNKHHVPTLWRKQLVDYVFPELFAYVLQKDGHGAASITERQRYIREDPEWFQFEWADELNRSNLYVYEHTPEKPGGYVRVLTEPDPNEDMKPEISKQTYYPNDIGDAGPVERFLFDFMDEFNLYWRMPESMRKSRECEPFYWQFGNDLHLDPDIHYLYFNDVVGWNELYWDLYHAIGRQWKHSDFMEAWRTGGYETEKKLVAEHDAQRFLFWCMENDYTLDDLKQMVSEKRILTKRFLGTKQDSWMTLQYGL